MCVDGENLDSHKRSSRHACASQLGLITGSQGRRCHGTTMLRDWCKADAGNVT